MDCVAANQTQVLDTPLPLVCTSLHPGDPPPPLRANVVYERPLTLLVGEQHFLAVLHFEGTNILQQDRLQLFWFLYDIYSTLLVVFEYIVHTT